MLTEETEFRPIGLANGVRFVLEGIDDHYGPENLFSICKRGFRYVQQHSRLHVIALSLRQLRFPEAHQGPQTGLIHKTRNMLKTHLFSLAHPACDESTVICSGFDELLYTSELMAVCLRACLQISRVPAQKGTGL